MLKLPKTQNSIARAILFIGLLSALQASSQSTHKYANSELTDFTDSLKNTPYPYILPIWGKKVQARGFDIPRPMGVMVNYSHAEQEARIDRVALSLDGIEYIDVTDILSFSKVRPVVNVVTVRPDVYILPFFNVSALAGYYSTVTEIQMTEPFEYPFTAKPSGPLFGVGAMLAGGIGPIFGSWESNLQWNFSKNWEKPNRSWVNGFRFGHQHKNHKKPLTGWTVWIGAESLTLAPQTLGKVNLSEVSGVSQEDKQQASDQLDAWYNSLGPIEQNTLEPFYNRVSGWLNNGDDTILYYDVNKDVVTQWNMIVGGQYQFNKNWQITAETTFGGTRWRTLLSLAYRFGLKSHKPNKKN